MAVLFAVGYEALFPKAFENATWNEISKISRSD
jgi:hypothetical protein